ncbi:MAG: hypothetical protein ACRDG3_04885 [Tepidiformaceae bacterium]
MPRPKYGLGQGLEALVSSRPAHEVPPSGTGRPEPLSRHLETEAAEAAFARWQYACLRFARGGKKRRLSLTISNPDTHVKPRRHRLRGIGRWTAIGVLGNEGWELVSLDARTYVFKRPIES